MKFIIYQVAFLKEVVIIYQYTNFYFNVKNDFYKIFSTCFAQISPKIKNAQNLLKFDTFNISNMPISIFISKWLTSMVKQITIITNEIYHLSGSLSQRSRFKPLCERSSDLS